MQRIDVAEYLLIAEAILGVDAQRLRRQADLGALESALSAPFAGWRDHDLYPSLAQRAAVLCSRLVRNHPLVDGNRRTAFLAMLEFIARNGGEWVPPDPSEAADRIERLAARELGEDEFAVWVGEQLA